MGLETGGGQNKTFLSVSDGKIAMRATETTAGAVKKSKKDGTPYWEVYYPAISGYLRGASKRETDWGARLVLDIEDEGTNYALEMPWSSRYSTGFFQCIPNIDVNQKIRFTPYMKMVKSDNGADVKKTMLYLSYPSVKSGDGKASNIDWAYTKENPNGCPPMIQVKVKGQMQWDDSDRQEFFESVMNSVLLPKLNASPNAETRKPAPINAPVAEKKYPNEPIEGETDDLPF